MSERAARLAAAVALALLLVAAIAERLGHEAELATAPAAARVLPSLAAMPAPRGAAVELLVPVHLGGEAASALLYEASWQRPDLRLSLPAAWPAGEPRRWALAVGGRTAAPGYREVWRSDAAALWERVP